jgi:hypothetical protein
MTTAAAKRTSLVAALALGVVGAGILQYRRYREEQRRAMTGGPKIAKVRKGMEVQTADEITLGRITAVWRGVDPVDPATPANDERCSRLEVQRPDGPLYVPYGAIGGIAGRSVVLTMTAEQVYERPWRYRPAWLPPTGRPEPMPQWGSTPLQ